VIGQDEKRQQRDGRDHNPHLPCDYQGGHRWSDPVRGEDTNGNKLTLVICMTCGKVRA
jgi:hypothetical protein